MSAALPRRWPEALRWGACFALALCFHTAGVAALLARWNESSDLVANAPVITIDLAPVATSSEITPSDLTPGPLSMQAEPEPRPEKPIDKIEVPTAQQAELEITPPPKPIDKPKDNKPRQKHASLASAPSPAERRAERAVAPPPGLMGSNARSSWNAQIAAQLERYKRPPPEDPYASGIAILAFSVDADGGVHNAHILRSSGSNVIDRETLSLVQRARPMPPPPPEIPDSARTFSVPVRYNSR
jgi:periplasmic protein TonB